MNYIVISETSKNSEKNIITWIRYFSNTSIENIKQRLLDEEIIEISEDVETLDEW